MGKRPNRRPSIRQSVLPVGGGVVHGAVSPHHIQETMCRIYVLNGYMGGYPSHKSMKAPRPIFLSLAEPTGWVNGCLSRSRCA